MSEFPFEQTAEVAPFEDGAEDGRRKPVVLVGGLVAALVLGAGGYFFLTGGDAAEDDFSVPVPKPAVAAPSAEPAPIEVVPAASSEVVGRNPFKVLYVEPAAATGGTTTDGEPTGTGTGTTSGPTTSPTTGTGTPSTGGTGTGTPSTGGTTSPKPAPQPTEAPKYITVVEVDAAANQVTFKSVDRAAEDPELVEQTHVVKPGEVFATYFRLFGYGTLLDAQGNPRDCTDLQYGDARLKLCEGESYQVS